MHAFVLGAGGFLGSHLCRRLTADGWEVAGLVRDPDAPYAVQRLGALAGGVRIVVGDASDDALVRREVATADAVFPLTGRSGAVSSMADPTADLRANVEVQLQILEAVRTENPAARVVFAGSRLQFGRVDRLPAGEDAPKRPMSVYGVHKQMADDYHRFYAEAHGIATTRLRITNAYGPLQFRPNCGFGLVGIFLDRALRNDEILLYGGGPQLRHPVYVDDITDAVVRAVTTPGAAGRAYNIGGPRSVSVRELAETIVGVVGSGVIREAPWPKSESSVETGDFVADITRARRELGWQPNVDLLDGIEATAKALKQDVRKASSRTAGTE